MLSTVSRSLSYLWNGVCAASNVVISSTLGKGVISVSLIAGAYVSLKKLSSKVSKFYKNYQDKIQATKDLELARERDINKKIQAGLCVCECNCGNLRKVNDAFLKHKSCESGEDDDSEETNEDGPNKSSSSRSSQMSGSSSMIGSTPSESSTSAYSHSAFSTSLSSLTQTKEPEEHKESAKKKKTG